VARVWFGVLGGYCRRLGVVMSDCPPILSYKGVSPFPRAFPYKCLIKVFFNKDIEMSYDMLYRQEKLVRV
jgi:hypothetical protein